LNLFAIWFQSKMGKFMKTGKVVLVLGGRFAGRKAVIVKVPDLMLLNIYKFLGLRSCKLLTYFCGSTVLYHLHPPFQPRYF